MSGTPRSFDLGTAAGHLMRRFGMRCAKEADLIYLGFLLAGNGLVDVFRPFFRECLKRYLKNSEPRPCGMRRHTSRFSQ